MKKFLAHLLASAFIFVFLLPVFAHAQNFNLIVCENQNVPEYNHSCGFEDLMKMIGNLINALIVLATLIATIILIYIGFLLVMPSANIKNKDKAKAAARSVVIGYLWILGAWVLVYTIFNTLLKSEYSNVFR